ncbi:protein phosphatase [Streptoalloteichus tenebrarius]|uniref:Protein phosphatase n=1 Tax=Streptoalloteichus tenebrarius (strain ATCC 17920 / DSM 40477 / JCM 4838 / CBS 697.72 / NBRC 16177 / NCIMB 11028 / NRRL B-12390 / A12253. 1 / ISP 5477) TaxID=1933 RepID=A0ABT1I1H6_STRSD|nr:hypothetical protein [Streptoalloteichus tenebrarius]MCP2261619.1 protein phosphatase [Streptoalloteichus tenebrarius]BFE99380.1 hypothetical protein GCM10020241_10560 [Streptoalloteichus tenebrarius]
MTTTASDLVVGHATEKGPKRPLNADAAAHHVHGGRLAAAIVDGTGSTAEVADLAGLAATTAVRVAARRTPVLGIVAASELCADAENELPTPDGAIVVAATRPGRRWLVAWAGDSVAYAATDGQVKRVTNPHTRGHLLRVKGAAEEEARRADHQLMHSLARVPVYGVWAMEAQSDMLVLASDGLHRLPATEMTGILAAHACDPEMCAQQLVKAGRQHSNDDITVMVLPHPETPPGWR